MFFILTEQAYLCSMVVRTLLLLALFMAVQSYDCLSALAYGEEMVSAQQELLTCNKGEPTEENTCCSGDNEGTDHSETPCATECTCICCIPLMFSKNLLQKIACTAYTVRLNPRLVFITPYDLTYLIWQPPQMV